MLLNEYVRKKRIQQGMTQAELAKQMKISRVLLNKVENNQLKAGRKFIRAVSKYFKIDLIDVIEMANTGGIYETDE